MDGLAADGGGQRNNAQGRGEEEVVLGRGNNRNVREDEANLGQGAGNPVDPDEERMFRLMRALRVKVSIPVFKGDKAEDPMEFKTKALDYMDAQEIPIRERVFEFRHCLEGKARMWYDEITLPRTWDELMTMFCARFCIYGKSNEDWYHHWASLHFDPASDSDIDDLINEVRSVTRLLNFPNDVVLATLKNMFPSYRIHFLNVNDLQTMFCMLRAMFPRNRHQSMAGAHGGATPFSVHQDKPSAVPVLQKSKKGKKPDKTSREDENLLDEAFDRLQDSIDHLTVMTECKDRNGRFRPSRSGSRPYRCHPPFKPTISRRHKNYYRNSNPPFRRSRSYPPERYQEHQSSAPYRGSNRYRNDRYSGGRRDFKFDKSPRGRKPRVASKTPDQDRDRCYNCHEFGHFARECPYAEESASNNETTSPDTRATREKRVPGRKQCNNNASFQFSNQDHQTASEADEFDDPEMDYMMPFFDNEVLNI